MIMRFLPNLEYLNGLPVERENNKTEESLPDQVEGAEVED